MNSAKIIVIEGTDCSGKETQSKKLYEYLVNNGYRVKRYSFPIYESATGKIVGGPYLGKKEICDSYFKETSANVDPIVSSLYYAADRRYNFLNEIEDELYKNDVIILDRYTTSNMGHQISKAKNDIEREQLLKFIDTLEYDLCQLPRPDIVLFLHMSLDASKYLMKDRKYSDGNESNIEHLKKSEETYLWLCNYYNWEYINCLNNKVFNKKEDIKTIEEIHNEIVLKVDKLLKDKKNNRVMRMTRF